MSAPQKGRLIVLEGTDGSGKSTQFAKLCQRVQAEGIAFRRLVFPQYQEESSACCGCTSAGSSGSGPEDVNAYAASSFYAVDRYASWKKVWQQDYLAGGLMLADRYTTSNAVHQSSKVPEGERPAFFQWLFDFEYHRLGLPEPDLVLYLDMPTDRAWPCSASGKRPPTPTGTSMRPTAPTWPPAAKQRWRRRPSTAGKPSPAWTRRETCGPLTRFTGTSGRRQPPLLYGKER